MLFIHPMWDSESERLGMQKCTPIGSVMKAIGELVGFIGLFALIATIALLMWKLLGGAFRAYMLWWMAVPLGIGAISQVMVSYSWRLAGKKDFKYDYNRRDATWMEAGERRSFPDNSTP